jgi:hypothetical protein
MKLSKLFRDLPTTLDNKSCELLNAEPLSSCHTQRFAHIDDLFDKSSVEYTQKLMILRQTFRFIYMLIAPFLFTL